LNSQTKELGANLSAGALCTELALFINPLLEGINHLPALAGVADKSAGKDIESYVKLSGYSLEELNKWSLIIDHETYFLKFNPRTALLYDLFFPTKINRSLLTMYKDIEKDLERVKLSAKKYVKIKDYGKFKLLRINRDKVGDYGYASSKLIRIAHELEKGPRITFAETASSIGFRADQVKFSGVDMLEELKEKFPYALVSGGGHDVAGSIRFNAASKEEIMGYVYKYLEKV